MAEPAVSILLPVAADVATTLRALQALARLPEEPAFEVVVVVAEEDGATRALTDGLEGDVRVVLTPEPSGFGAACDRAAEVATAPLLVALTAEAVPADGWLGDVVAAFGDGDGDGVAAVLPRSLSRDGADLPPSGWRALAVTAAAYAAVGGFAGTRRAGRAEKETLLDALAEGAAGTVVPARAAVLLAD